MKLSDIEVKIITAKQGRDYSEANSPKELADLNCNDCVLKFPDGTEILISTSEWAQVYIKEFK